MSSSHTSPGWLFDRSDFLAGLPKSAFNSLCAQADHQNLTAGDVLFEENDPADALYVVLSGSLGIFVDRKTIAKRMVAIAGKGETIGETAIMAGGNRTASVIALRDTELLRISRAQFERLIANHPDIAVPLTRILAMRLRHANNSPSLTLRPKVISFIPASDEIDTPAIAHRLKKTIEAELGYSVHVQEQESEDWDSNRLNDLENQYDLIILCSSFRNEAWVRSCTRQSDRVCLIMRFTDNLPPLLRESLGIMHDHQLVDLFILHENDDVCPRLTRDILEISKADRHFHIRLQQQSDWGRWARVLTGRGIGLVLSGGGARAYAHIGIIQALREAHIPIDFVGGVSMGGIIAASLAMGWDTDTVRERIRECFVKSNPLSDYTLPLQGLVRGTKVENLLRTNFGTIQISDLWLPFYCVSTNLTNAQHYRHERGRLWKALRASVSLPGILPPVVTDHGVLVDGGVMNNLPVIEMQRLCHGPVIAVDVSRDLAVTPQSWTKLISQPLIYRMLKPPIISLLMRSGTVTGESQVQQQSENAHINLDPPLGPIDIRDWQAFEETIELGYEYARERLSSDQKLKDLQLQSEEI